MGNTNRANGSNGKPRAQTASQSAAQSWPPAGGHLMTWPEAYAASRDEMMAIPREALIGNQGVDIPSAVTMALKAAPRLRALAADMKKALETFDPESIDRLERYTAALAHAHSMYLAADPSQAVVAVAAEASELRETLKQDVASLLRHGLLERMPALSGLTGYRNIAYDLNALHQLLRDNWERVGPKTPLPYADVMRAATLSAKLVAMSAGRSDAEADASEAAEMRMRAYTLFYTTYEKVRRAVCYVRWNDGDAHEVMPSVYATRSSRKGARHEAHDTVVDRPSATLATAARTTDATPPPLPAQTPTGVSGDGPFSD